MRPRRDGRIQQRDRRAKVVIDYRSTGCWAVPPVMPQCCPAQLKTLKRFVCAQAFFLFGWTMGI
jgi:hypothetical protein